MERLYELNFELPEGLDAKRHQRLLDLAIIYFVKLAKPGSFAHRSQPVAYDSPDGPVEAEVHVVKLDVISEAVDFEAHVAAMAFALRQDCIAIRYADGNGSLEGPNAAKWGAFDPEYFVRF